MRAHLPKLSGLATLIRSLIVTAISAALIVLIFGFVGRQPEIRALLKEQGFTTSVDFLRNETGHWATTYPDWPQALYEQYRTTPAYCIEESEINDLQKARCLGVKRELYAEAGLLAIPPILVLLIFWNWLGAAGDWLWMARNSFERSRLIGTTRVERVLKKRYKFPDLWAWKRGLRRRELKMERGHWITVYVHPKLSGIQEGGEVELFSSVGSKEWSVRPLAVPYSRYVHVTTAKKR